MTTGSGKSMQTFIDLFAGCGGLSLGLLQSGWRGLFAIERSPDAFKTLRHNLVDANNRRPFKNRFQWPDWLPIESMEIGVFLSEHRASLRRLRGSVTLVAGGPPCQGFSFAGKRKSNDPRNQLFKQYIEVVKILMPKVILLENVKGISVPHGYKEWKANGKAGKLAGSYAEKLEQELDRAGYEVKQLLVKSCDYGVPQFRPRYLTIGISRSENHGNADTLPDVFEILRSLREPFLTKKGLPTNRHVWVSEAISDLRITNQKLIDYVGPDSRNGFMRLASVKPRTKYQRLMHGKLNGQPVNSLRLPNHKPETVAKFKAIHKTCTHGVQLSAADRERLGIKKNTTVLLAAKQASHTVMTLPDDLIHYEEPRIHTVRENARLQSFPDWFDFLGKYTTGGMRRAVECPRYSQVGNAVPPQLAEAVGLAIKKAVSQLG